MRLQAAEVFLSLFQIKQLLPQIKACYNPCTMILYVDETENGEYFIVTGLLVDSEAVLQLAYKRFKKKLKGFNIKTKYKSKLFTEFKSTLLDNTYTRVKERMLEELIPIESKAIYSCYVKKGVRFNQELKESVYVALLSRIIGEIASRCKIIFDSFGKKDFEDKIIRAFSGVECVEEIRPSFSENEPGLQFVDNICSVIRLHISDDKKDLYYDRIKHMIKEV